MPGGTGERFNKIAEELFGGNVSEFARNMEMTPGAFTKYMKGDTMPGGKVLKRLISLDINPAWLLAGIPPMRISEIEEAGVRRIHHKDQKEFKSQKNKKKGEGSRIEKPANPDFFAHINEENLNETESALLEEAKRFSRDLEKWQIPPRVKLLMLELMIEHIGQEIERLHNSRP